MKMGIMRNNRLSKSHGVYHALVWDTTIQQQHLHILAKNDIKLGEWQHGTTITQFLFFTSETYRAASSLCFQVYIFHGGVHCVSAFCDGMLFICVTVRIVVHFINELFCSSVWLDYYLHFYRCISHGAKQTWRQVNPKPMMDMFTSHLEFSTISINISKISSSSSSPFPPNRLCFTSRIYRWSHFIYLYIFCLFLCIWLFFLYNLDVRSIDIHWHSCAL